MKFKFLNFFVSLMVLTDNYVGYFKLPDFGFKFDRVNKYNIIVPACFINNYEKGIKLNYLMLQITAFGIVYTISIGTEKFTSTFIQAEKRTNIPIDYSNKFKYLSGDGTFDN